MVLPLVIGLALIAFLPAGASAQSSIVVCSSRNDLRATCRADLRDGVLLERQLSRSPCEFGDTWGIDSSRSNTIWVDSGCRGEFRVRAPAGAGGSGPRDPYAHPVREAYVRGYLLGVSDKRARRRADYARHRDQFAATEATHFRRGYDDGYIGRPAESTPAAPDEQQRRARELGARRGADDRRYGLTPDYARWRGDYESAFESYFKSGYEDGYGGRRRGLEQEQGSGEQ